MQNSDNEAKWQDSEEVMETCGLVAELLGSSGKVTLRQYQVFHLATEYLSNDLRKDISNFSDAFCLMSMKI